MWTTQWIPDFVVRKSILEKLDAIKLVQESYFYSEINMSDGRNKWKYKVKVHHNILHLDKPLPSIDWIHFIVFFYFKTPLSCYFNTNGIINWHKINYDMRITFHYLYTTVGKILESSSTSFDFSVISRLARKFPCNKALGTSHSSMGGSS